MACSPCWLLVVLLSITITADAQQKIPFNRVSVQPDVFTREITFQKHSIDSFTGTNEVFEVSELFTNHIYTQDRINYTKIRAVNVYADNSTALRVTFDTKYVSVSNPRVQLLAYSSSGNEKSSDDVESSDDEDFLDDEKFSEKEEYQHFYVWNYTNFEKACGELKPQGFYVCGRDMVLYDFIFPHELHDVKEYLDRLIGMHVHLIGDAMGQKDKILGTSSFNVFVNSHNSKKDTPKPDTNQF